MNGAPLAIAASDKYALLGVQLGQIDESLPNSLALAERIWFCRQLPIEVPSHWGDWLGKIQLDQLQQSDALFLCVTASSNPDVYDSENLGLMRFAYRLYLGLALAVPNFRHASGLQVGGANSRGQVEVREVSGLDEVHKVLFAPSPAISEGHIREAFAIARGIGALNRPGQYDRCFRMLEAFMVAARSRNIGVRIHQFVRCVEGLIFPRIGQSKKDFSERGTLFAGDGSAGILGDLYEIRGAVEHLHPALSALPRITKRERAMLLLERAIQAEALARSCLKVLLTEQKMWPYFQNQFTLEQFWVLEKARRVELWGAATEPTEAVLNWPRAYLSDEELGLPDSDDVDISAP